MAPPASGKVSFCWIQVHSKSESHCLSRLSLLVSQDVIPICLPFYHILPYFTYTWLGHWLCLYKFVNSTLAVLCETWFQASTLQRFMQSPRSKVQCQHPVCRPFAFVPKNQTELVQRLQNCKDTTRIHKVCVMYATWAVFVLDVSMSCRLIGLIYLPGTSRTM